MAAATGFQRDELDRFERDGFMLSRELFDSQEIGALAKFAHRDPALREHAYDRADAKGRATKLALWNDPPPAPYGLFTCAERIVERAEQLLDGEVYHWHTKMTMKEPNQGGAWEWHQDYGYWYYNGCLFPRLISCMIAIDAATRENGCLQVLTGSHTLGRLDHGRTGDQSGAAAEQVAEAVSRFDRVTVEMRPGDALFFHCNLLHRSDANLSPHPRWTIIGCFNAADNSPYKPTRHPAYAPLNKVADTAIKQWIQQGSKMQAAPRGSSSAFQSDP